MKSDTSAGKTFDNGYFCHFVPILEPRHIRTKSKRLVFCLGSQSKQKLHILPRFCWEPRHIRTRSKRCISFFYFVREKKIKRM